MLSQKGAKPRFPIFLMAMADFFWSNGGIIAEWSLNMLNYAHISNYIYLCQKAHHHNPHLNVDFFQIFSMV